MKILGIDPALKVTGYGAITLDSKHPKLLKAGAIITSPKDELPERLCAIYESSIKVLSEIKPDVVILEKLYVHYHHPTTAYLLGQARGIICLACAKAKVQLVEFSPTRVKKATVGKGLASKTQVQRMVLNFLKLKAAPRYNDVTDALALAIAYCNYIRT